MLDNFGGKTLFCLDCEVKVEESSGSVQFKDGFRCKECAVEYKKSKFKNK